MTAKLPTIRNYEPGEQTQVAALWREVFPNHPKWNVPEQDIARKVGFQPEPFLVAVLDRQVVGTAMGGYDGHRGWVYLVAVAPALRRQGIGEALMRAIEAALSALIGWSLSGSIDVLQAEFETAFVPVAGRVSPSGITGQVVNSVNETSEM